MFSNKKYLEKIRSFILKHNETKDLKIEDKDLLIVYNYLENKNQSINSGYRMVLKFKPYIHVVFQETSKVKKFTLKTIYKKIVFYLIKI